MVAAGLREVATRGDAQPRAQRLEQDGHEVRNEDDRKQRVAELRATGEVRGPVAGVHVTDGDEVTRPGEGEHLAPEAQRPWHGDRAVDFLQAGCLAGQTPRRAGMFGGSFVSVHAGQNSRVGVCVKKQS